ncbi:MAG: EamA family transporter, partial [Candidatus Sericytochromatia bacterium]
MTVLAFSLILASGLGWSGLDWARKTLAPTIRPMPMVLLLFAGQAVLLAIYALWRGLPAIAPAYWAPAAGSIALNLVVQVMYVRALALSPLSLTIPYLSFAPVFTTVAGMAMLGEVPESLDLAGLLLVVAGALSLSTAENGGLGARAAMKALLSEPGSWRMLAIAALWAVAYPLDKLAIQASSASFHSVMLTVGVLAGLLLALGWRGRLGELKDYRCRPGP